MQSAFVLHPSNVDLLPLIGTAVAELEVAIAIAVKLIKSTSARGRE
jgi:hypothetical protein